jgi:hypothetical protein
MLAPRLGCLLVVVLALWPQTAFAQSRPLDELLRFVPEDTGLCLLAQDLRTYTLEVMESPLADRLRKSSLLADLVSTPEWKLWLVSVKQVEKALELSWREMLDDVLGQAVVFAFRPGPPGKPELEQGLLLIRARKADTLARLVDRINEVQKASGELRELQTRQYRGQQYHCRVEDKQTNFYLLRGQVLLFTAQEAFLRAAIDREKQSPPDESVWSVRLRDLGLERAVAGLAINPRAYDEAMLLSGENGSTNRLLTTLWKDVQGFGLGLHLEQQSIRLTCRVLSRGKSSHPALSRFLAAADKPSTLWNALPENTLLAVGGRFDGQATLDLLRECLGKQAQDALFADLQRSVGAMLGKDLLKEVLPNLGPDWGLILVAPRATSKTWMPHMRFALRLTSPPGEDPPLEDTILQAIHGLAQMAVLAYNKKYPDRTLRLRMTRSNGCRIGSLTGEALLPGLEPAWAIKDGYLLLVTHPDEITAFTISRSQPSSEVPLLRVSFRNLLSYIKEHHQKLREALSANQRTEGSGSTSVLATLQEVLELFDKVELQHQSKPGAVTFTLRVDLTRRLRK